MLLLPDGAYTCGRTQLLLFRARNTKICPKLSFLAKIRVRNAPKSRPDGGISKIPTVLL